MVIMKAKSLINIICAISILLSACSKSDSNESGIEGYVRCSQDRRAIEGATVRLTSHQSDLFGSGDGNILQTQLTDANGKYSFTYKKSKDLSYRVSCVHPKYFFDFDKCERVLSTFKKQDVETLYPIPEAWIKLYAKRVTNAKSCFFNTETGIETFDTSGIEKFIIKDKYRVLATEISYTVRYLTYNDYKNKNVQLKPFDTREVRIEL
jgi:hypothetical protein